MRPIFRYLLLAVFLVGLVCLYSLSRQPAREPAEPPLGSAKITLSDQSPITHQPAQAAHLSFAGVWQEGKPAPLWSVKITPQHRPYGAPLISPDGRWLVLATETTVLVFDLRERKVTTQWTCPGHIVRLFFDSSAPRLIGIFNASERPLSSFKEGHATLGFWTLPSLEFTSRPLLSDPGPAINVAITHSQDRVLAIAPDATIGVFDVATGRQLFRFERHRSKDAGPNFICAGGGAAISHDDQVVTSETGGPDPNGRLRRWRLTDGQEIPTGPEGYDYERDGGSNMTYAPNGRVVLTGAGNWGLTLNKAEDGHGIYWYFEHGYDHYDGRSPNVAIVRANSGRFGVMDVMTGQLLFKAELEPEQSAIYPELHWAILSPDGRTVYTGANNGYILAWDFAAASELPPEELVSGTDWVSFIARDGDRVQTLEADRGPRGFNRVVQWDLKKHKLLKSAPAESFSPEEYQDAGANTTRWRWGTFVLNGNICTVTGRVGEARAFEPISGRTLFHLGGDEPKLNAAGLDLRDVFSGHVALAVSPDGTILAVGSGTLTFWDPRDGSFLSQLYGHDTSVTTVRFSANGRRLVSGDYEGRILVRPVPRPGTTKVDRASGQDTRLGQSAPLQQLTSRADPQSEIPPPTEWVILPAAGARGSVVHADTNSDGTLVAAVHATGNPYQAGAGGTVTVWQDTRRDEWRQLFTYALPRAPSRVALSPDQRLLAVALLNPLGKSNALGESYGDVFVLDAHTGQLRFVLTWVDALDLTFLNDHQIITAGNGLQIWTLPGL